MNTDSVTSNVVYFKRPDPEPPPYIPADYFGTQHAPVGDLLALLTLFRTTEKPNE